MTQTYLITPINPVTEEALGPVTVTVHSEAYEHGADADGRQGDRRQEITGMDVDSDQPLPEWADREARDIARYKWMEGR